MTPVVAKIISMQPNFTVGENEIAQYVIDNPDAIISSTVSAVAEQTGTSEASVNRFCKKIGYKGFNRLKVALAQESAFNKVSSISAPAQGGSLLAVMCQDYQRVLLNTTAMLEESVITQAAQALKEARLVYLFGLADTVTVAAEFADKLSLVGIPNKAVTNTTNIRIECSHVKKSDFAIFIVSSVFGQDILPTVSLVRERGAKALIITSYDSPQLATAADMKLVTSDIITTQNAVSISNNLIFLYVVDILYACLLNSDKSLRDKKLNSDALRNSGQNTNFYFGY